MCVWLVIHQGRVRNCGTNFDCDRYVEDDIGKGIFDLDIHHEKEH
jgi:hypothetical protein